MRLELQAEVEDLNSAGARNFRASDYASAEELVRKGKALQVFLQKVTALEDEWMSSFAEKAPSSDGEEVAAEAARKILSGTKSSKTALLVRYPNGDVVAERKAAETLVAVIKRAGFERVAELGIPVNGENIVSRSPSKRYNEIAVRPYYIKTHSSTAQKKRNIEQISEALDLGLTVEII
jgi:hypothetical protein